MSTHRVPDQVIDQLRSNLRAAGIQAAEADIQGIVEKGFLSRLVDIERVIAQAPIDVVPDYLSDWSLGADEQPQPNPMDAAIHRPSSSIAIIAAQLRARQISPTELTEQALTRIAERDPELNAFQLVLAEPARAAARRAEQELAAGVDRGPLHGVPVAVKDLLALRGTPTTAGSNCPPERRASASRASVSPPGNGKNIATHSATASTPDSGDCASPRRRRGMPLPS